jgi:hypothetical protein
MNTPGKQTKQTVQTPIFEPFPEPRTMPEGWDLSALLNEPAPSVDEQPKNPSTY